MGFSIAAPVGPIGLLCIRRTLVRGWKTGISTGLGAASADAMYGFIAGTGLNLVSVWLLGAQPIIRLAGGVYLIYLGVRIIRANPSTDVLGEVDEKGPVGAYFSALALTLSNPATILMFLSVFSGFQESSGKGSVLPLLAGVFGGSLSWWILLTTAVGVIRLRLSPRAMVWINRASGGIIAAFGLISIISIFTAR